MPESMQENLRPRLLVLQQLAHEILVILQKPPAVPLGNHKEGVALHPELSKQVEDPVDLPLMCRGHVMHCH